MVNRAGSTGPSCGRIAASMNPPVQLQPANVELTKDAEYREAYANSVQVRANLWDFLLTFGTMEQAGVNWKWHFHTFAIPVSYTHLTLPTN